MRSPACTSLPLACLLTLTALPFDPAHAGPVRLGVLGDSVADEYRFPANFPPGGDRRAARNFVELMADLRDVDLGGFSTAARGEPRNQGFAHNWARDGATTADLAPQAAGLAGQAAAGEVDYALVFIGGNDFRGLFAPGADPAAVFQGALTNTAAAVDTLLASDPDLRVALSNVPDITLLPEAQFALAQNPLLAQPFAQVGGLIDQYNAVLAGQFAADERVAIVDTNGLFEAIIEGGQNRVGSVTLDTRNPGSEIDRLFVDAVNPGTIGQGLLANEFIDTLDGEFGADVGRFSDAELVAAAAANAIPVPAAFWAGLATVPLVLAARRRWRAAA